jgi:hypothetical protein
LVGHARHVTCAGLAQVPAVRIPRQEPLCRLSAASAAWRGGTAASHGCCAR